MSAKRLHAYTLLLIVSFVWGIAGPIIKFTERGIPAIPFLVYRFGISAIFILILFLFGQRQKIKSTKDFLELILYGLLAITLGLGILFWGLEHTSVLEMNLITSTSPLITSILGVKLLGEHLTKREKIGLGLALIGTLITIFSRSSTDKIHTFGNLLVFGYVVFTAFSSVVSKKLLRRGYNGFFISNVGFLVLLSFS
ncbi:DMT family transporter, partial [Candidatus Microgenomates bacterium]|nr:DMT family transporter [Candidatus Microgenomates bacterium]